MLKLMALPAESFSLIIGPLVGSVGIRKAICARQVVDFHNPNTPDLAYAMSYKLHGKMFLAKSRAAAAKANRTYLSVIASVNQTLDVVTGETSTEALRQRHESVAQAANIVKDLPVGSKLEAQNNLSGAIIIGDLNIAKYLLTADECSPAVADVNENTPYFGRPLTLAATCGHIKNGWDFGT